MDPVLWAKTAPAVRDTLAKIDPDGKDTFDKNLATFETDAAALDRDCALAVNTIPFAQRTLVTAHDAFGYFGRRYGLAVRGIQGISTESEPSLGDIENLVAKIADERVPAIFIETTVSDRTVRAVVDGCAARGHDLKIGEALYSDSLGRAGSPEGTWTGMLRHNAKSIANALGGRG
jgi:manganese/zinc/iron transport system substrate-binding protein